jgi:peptidoglycan/LPS O-acetylase OafA/YrhL
MGFIRFYLAICVLVMHADHLHDLPLPRGRHAVQLFFVISGFYMAMILSGRYDSLKNFYASRWSRIASPYYIHAIIFVLISLVTGFFFENFLVLSAYFSNSLQNNGWAGILLAAITNFTIFGQDLSLFFKDNIGSGLQFTTKFSNYPDPLWKYLVIPQCWTVALELYFYALAPLLNKLKSPALLTICLLSFLSRIIAYQFFGLEHDPWINRFFPFELGLFIVGMLSFRCLRSFEKKGFSLPSVDMGKYYFIIIPASLILGSGFYGFYQICTSWGIANYTILIALFLSGPVFALFFSFTRHNKLDRIIGELSYPIYLNHLFFIILFRGFPAIAILPGGVMTNSLVASVLAAWAFWFFVGRKLDEARHQKFLSQAAAGS